MNIERNHVLLILVPDPQSLHTFISNKIGSDPSLTMSEGITDHGREPATLDSCTTSFRRGRECVGGHTWIRPNERGLIGVVKAERYIDVEVSPLDQLVVSLKRVDEAAQS